MGTVYRRPAGLQMDLEAGHDPGRDVAARGGSDRQHRRQRRCQAGGRSCHQLAQQRLDGCADPPLRGRLQRRDADRMGASLDARQDRDAHAACSRGRGCPAGAAPRTARPGNRRPMASGPGPFRSLRVRAQMPPPGRRRHKAAHNRSACRSRVAAVAQASADGAPPVDACSPGTVDRSAGEPSPGSCAMSHRPRDRPAMRDSRPLPDPSRMPIRMSMAIALPVTSTRSPCVDAGRAEAAPCRRSSVLGALSRSRLAIVNSSPSSPSTLTTRSNTLCTQPRKRGSRS